MKKLFVLLFVFACFSMENFAQSVYGDVNGDGYVTTADVTAIYNILLGAPPYPTTYVVNGVAFNMMVLPSGTFYMGATEEQGSDATNNEKPAHRVKLSSFSIGVTEVTQELWQAVMGSNPSWFNGTGVGESGPMHPDEDYGVNLQRPVEMVSWEECQEFITKLNQMTGKTFRLPTEAEWEYAARGGNSQGHKYAGSDYIDDVAWYYDNAVYYQGAPSPNYGTNTVATKAANEFGLFDMTGNVQEFCQDWYDPNYYTYSPFENPTGPDSAYGHTVRGGAWNNRANICRVSYRNTTSPTDKQSNLGFRLAQ